MQRRRPRLCLSLLIIAFSGLLLNACDNPRPDLKRLYRSSSAGVDQPPVILVPGILGSRLRDRQSGREVWPGSLFDKLFGDFTALALDIDPATLEPRASALEAFALTDQALGRDFYGRIVETLTRAGGYVAGRPGTPNPRRERRYYLFAYDWRQDGVISAAALDALIEQIRRDYDDPQLKVDIVAHSMGGLVVRYYLRYGGVDVLDGNDFPVNNRGADRVRRVVMLGTPNLGSVSSLHSFLRGYAVGLRGLATETLATMPSVYQLFPHPLNTWLIGLDGRPLERDLFEARIWQRFQWSVFDPAVIRRVGRRFSDPRQAAEYIGVLQRYFDKRLERARRFVWSLSFRAGETPIRYIVFGGDCILTPARLLVEEVNGESLVRLRPEDIAAPLPGVPYERLMLEPGDGRVTKPSLLARESLDPTVPRHEYTMFPLDHSFVLCEAHDTMTGNINFQDNLLNVLLTRTRAMERDSVPQDFRQK